MLWPIFILVFAAVAIGCYCLAKLFFEQSSYEEWALNSLNRQMVQLGGQTSLTPERILQITFMVAAGLFIIGLLAGQGNILGGILLGFMLAVIGLIAPHIIVSYLIRKRLERINEELPGALEIISSSLRAGLTLNQAIARNLDRLPVTISEEFRIILYECRLGSSMTEALRSWSERVDLMDVKLTVIASELALRHGGNLAESYIKLSKTIRDRYMFQQEVQSLTTEGRMQAIVMTILPFVILILMTLIRRKEMLEFLSSPIGIGSVVTVFVMQLIAYIWISKTMEIDI